MESVPMIRNMTDDLSGDSPRLEQDILLQMLCNYTNGKFNSSEILDLKLEDPQMKHLISNCTLMEFSNTEAPLTMVRITTILYFIIWIVGLCGNTLVIYVVLRFSKMQTVTNMYIFNLALADEMFLTGLPFLITTMTIRDWIFGQTMCKSLSDYDYTMSGLDGVVQPLLTDMYQISMAYAYWHTGKHQSDSVFDLFFRVNPFQGEFTVFAGLGDCVEFLRKFRFSASDIEYLKAELPTAKPEFFDYLAQLTARDVKLHAVPEGTVVFPRIPLLRVEGPLALVQLLETALLNLINYASLVATNAARFRLAAGPEVELLEFGLRRAQGPNGGLSASKYAYLGGFDGTSNVMAGKLFQIPIRGTHAHAFVMSFASTNSLQDATLTHRTTGQKHDLLALSFEWRDKLRRASMFESTATQANDGELCAFISYALAFPEHFLGLVDTYDVIRSGLINFCAVAMALDECGYRAIGIRIDSGDLAYLSRESYKCFQLISSQFDRPYFVDLRIVASNDINEETVISLNEQGHNINSYGIGTHLVTCQKQPALGCVYKLVEINRTPCIKLSNDLNKVTIPGRKKVYRLYGQNGNPLLDLMQLGDEDPPEVGSKVLCRHPFEETKRAYVCPHKVELLHQLYWSDGVVRIPNPDLKGVRNRVLTQMKSLRADIKRTLNPTPYKVSVSEKLYTFMHDLWLENAPIGKRSFRNVDKMSFRLNKIYMTTTSINQFTSSLLLTVMSADRYIAVCHPISSPRYRTPFIAKFVCLTAWTVSALLMVPVYLYATAFDIPKETINGIVHSRKVCNIYWMDTPTLTGQTAFTLYSFFLGFAIPLVLILVFYFLVIFKLSKVGPKTKSKNKKRSHRKVTYLVLTVITCYIFCWLPYWVGQIIIILRPTSSNAQRSQFQVAVFLLSGCLAYANSAINPVLYAFLSDNFKKSFAKAFTCASKKDVNAQLHVENSIFPGGRTRGGSTRGANGTPGLAAPRNGTAPGVNGPRLGADLLAVNNNCGLTLSTGQEFEASTNCTRSEEHDIPGESTPNHEEQQPLNETKQI